MTEGPGDDTTPPSVTYSIESAAERRRVEQHAGSAHVDRVGRGIRYRLDVGVRDAAARGGSTDLTFTCTATNVDGLSAAVTAAVRIDRTPPAVSCGTPDGLWHATDVSIACTATDSASGIALPGLELHAEHERPGGHRDRRGGHRFGDGGRPRRRLDSGRSCCANQGRQEGPDHRHRFAGAQELRPQRDPVRTVSCSDGDHWSDRASGRRRKDR